MPIGRRSLTAAALAATMVFPATAMAGDYPAPTDPGKGPKKLKNGGTLRVCKKGCKYKKIQKAIDVAGKRTTIRVGRGTYKEGLKVLSPKKDGLKLIGNPSNPGRVVLNGKGLRGGAAQNGVQVNNADNVTVNGFTARNYKGNGFFVVNVTGYKLTNLVADTTGVYGLYAFNSKGGEMSNSEAFYHNDAGYYVGQTPPQTRPKRTTLKNLVSWGNVTGYSGTNSRYVTITDSKFFNNGIGVVPNVLTSEKFMPHEDNVIVDNDVFWNNFNYFKAAPFPLRRGATGEISYPVGTGILLFGGRTTKVENNRVWGNYLMGYGQISQVLLTGDDEPFGVLQGIEVRNNVFGKGGADLNARDMFYDGSGKENCFLGNQLRSKNVPEDNSTFVDCPVSGRTTVDNQLNQGAQREAIGWTAASDREASWIKHPHQPIEGITPLETWTAAYPRPEVK